MQQLKLIATDDDDDDGKREGREDALVKLTHEN